MEDDACDPAEAKRSHDALAAIDAVRESIRERRHGRNVLEQGEDWRAFIEDGRRT